MCCTNCRTVVPESFLVVNTVIVICIKCTFIKCSFAYELHYNIEYFYRYRLAALQKNGEDGWKNRVKKESKDVNSNVTLRPKVSSSYIIEWTFE